MKAGMRCEVGRELLPRNDANHLVVVGEHWQVAEAKGTEQLIALCHRARLGDGHRAGIDIRLQIEDSICRNSTRRVLRET